MTEPQTIDWIIEMVQDVPKRRNMDSLNKQIFDTRLKTLLEIKAKLKRIDSFGGAEYLIAKALKAAETESLFPVE